MLNIVPVHGIRLTRRNKELLEKIQHRCIKMITNMRGKTYEERLVFFGVMDTTGAVLLIIDIHEIHETTKSTKCT